MDSIHAAAREVEKSAKSQPDTMTPGDPMLQFFHCEHLPEALRAVSRPFGVLAKQIVENLPRNPERTVALRKLLEAKDCAVRAILFTA
jgi:hypothetical protein